MPELPEVETTLRGIKPHVLHQKISQVIVRHPTLRWPIKADINQIVKGQTILDAQRIGKYILLKTRLGTLIFHLGMSGSLRIFSQSSPAKKHDHVDIIFNQQTILRLNDPRRFGAMLWTEDDPLKHPLLVNLGPEPLSHQFSSHYLWAVAQKRKVPCKTFIMNSHIVVGVGNIYANEALFDANIHPNKPAHELTKEECSSLVKSIKKILKKAIKQGGTTLKDFVNSDGKPGYFSMQLKVYGRTGLPCVVCETSIQEIRLGQRSTFFCSVCNGSTASSPRMRGAPSSPRKRRSP